MDYALAIVTCKDQDEAGKIQEALVKERLAACVKALEASSCFSWKGKVEREKEVLLLIETKTQLLDKLFSRVKELHSYETPAVFAVSILKGESGFLKWIDEVTK